MAMPVDMDVDLEPYDLLQQQLNMLLLRGEHNVRSHETEEIRLQLDEIYPPVPANDPLRIQLDALHQRLITNQPMNVDEEYIPQLVHPLFPPFLQAQLPVPGAVMTPLQEQLQRLSTNYANVLQYNSNIVNYQQQRNREGVFQTIVTNNNLLDIAIQIKDRIIGLGVSPLINNQVLNVINNIKKILNKERAILMRFDGYNEDAVLALSFSLFPPVEPIPPILTTTNLWTFIRDTYFRNELERMNANPRVLSNILNGYLSSSVIQSESFFDGHLTPNNVITSLQLGRYGVVVENINFIPAIQIVSPYKNHASVFGTAAPAPAGTRLAEAYNETPLGQRIGIPGPGNIPFGGLFFNCRIVDLQPKNAFGPNTNNLPATLLSSPNPAPGGGILFNGTRRLPNATLVERLHFSIHGGPNIPAGAAGAAPAVGASQCHIKFHIGQRINGQPTKLKTAVFKFSLMKFVNDANQEVDKIIITDNNNDGILGISDRIATTIINRYFVPLAGSHPLPLNANDSAIIMNPASRNEHKLYLRNAFYHFLLGIENFLSDARNSDALKLVAPFDPTRIMISLKNTYQADVDYKKYLKYKNKYLKLKKLIDNMKKSN